MLELAELPEVEYAKDAMDPRSWPAYRACIFLPWNLHAVSFVELLAAGLPLLVPDGDFAYSLTSALHLFRQDEAVYYSNQDGVLREPSLNMPSPFWVSTSGP